MVIFAIDEDFCVGHDNDLIVRDRIVSTTQGVHLGEGKYFTFRGKLLNLKMPAEKNFQNLNQNKLFFIFFKFKFKFKRRNKIVEEVIIYVVIFLDYLLFSLLASSSGYDITVTYINIFKEIK